MASSYVFRKIDGELWRQARARCLELDVKFLDVVQMLLRYWLRQPGTKGALKRRIDGEDSSDFEDITISDDK